ncbi:MAG: sugar phosphate isomerase/epimerase, partial [Chloroflexota bacterium]|nr:sugar phosphate isomerase/epimerase [Chloroflexota bacterium]
MAYREQMQHDQIALQLYTVRRLAAVDLPGTLRAVAAAGYRAVEVAGLPETAPGELARLLSESGLRAV